jgi:hypothetical protein
MSEKARFTGQAGIRKTSVVAVDVSKQVGWLQNRAMWIVRGRAWSGICTNARIAWSTLGMNRDDVHLREPR